MGFTTKVQLVDAVVAAAKVVLFSVMFAREMINDAYGLGSAIHYLNSFFERRFFYFQQVTGPGQNSHSVACRALLHSSVCCSSLRGFPYLQHVTGLGLALDLQLSDDALTLDWIGQSDRSGIMDRPHKSRGAVRLLNSWVVMSKVGQYGIIG